MKSVARGRRLVLFISALILAINFMSFNCLAEENKKVILIDPGHGGMDGGAVSKSGVNEKDINLKIGLLLKEELESMGYEVCMTRESDEGLYSDNGTVRQKKIEDLNKRCNMKKNSNCDLFISIHIDKFQDPKLCGIGAWYSNNPESEKLAHIIHENIKKDVNEKNKRLPKPAKEAYKVLRCNDTMPGIIMECGFISNPKELENLVNSDYQKLLATTFAKSIKQYFEGYEVKVEEEKGNSGIN